MLRVVPAVLLALLLAPIAAGLGTTLLCAFGWLPTLGGHALSLQPWRDLLATPGLAHAIRLTLTTGFAATLLALALAAAFCASAYGTRAFRVAQTALAPILATPHAALAIGFGFLIAPSGWLMRAASPWATGFDRPPDWVVVHDPWGVSLTLGLVLKETPYLLLMSLTALNQIPAEKTLRVAQSLGFGRVRAWFTGVYPLLYRQIRIPIYAVLAFSLSVVDVAIILGPSNPPTLAEMVLRDFNDPDLARWFPASAGAILLLVLVLASVAVWRGGEFIGTRVLAALVARGGRGLRDDVPAALVAASLGLGFITGFAAIGLLGVWSFAGLWRFPETWPSVWTLSVWRGQVQSLTAPASASLLIAGLVTGIAIVAVALSLEAADRRDGPGRLALLIYAPLVTPQIAFLFGVQIGLDRLALDGTLAAVVAVHLLFVLPYVFLSLADPWRAIDQRYARAAASLGAGPWRVFLTVKLPVMLRPLAIAAAVGIAVSIGAYLPTVFAGAGRIATLTTEAVTLSGSGDRRILGAYATLQTAIPLLAFGLALAVPRWVWRRRAGLRG